MRSVIADPQWFATAFAIKSKIFLQFGFEYFDPDPPVESVVQASIVIITTAAGKMQDASPTDSLDPAVTLWLIYAFLSVVISGALLVLSWTTWLPAARLAQVKPSLLEREVHILLQKKGLENAETKEDTKAGEKLLKSPSNRHENARWLFIAASIGIIFIGWALFGLGISWGVHGNVVAGTTGE